MSKELCDSAVTFRRKVTNVSKAKLVSPHHHGIENIRKMRNLHTCPQCMEPEIVECFIVTIVVLWKKIPDLHIACCGKCLEKLQNATIGEMT